MPFLPLAPSARSAHDNMGGSTLVGLVLVAGRLFPTGAR